MRFLKWILKLYKKRMLMKKKLLIALPLIGAVMFSGCATLFGGGGKQQVMINSSKPMNVSLGYLSDDNKTAINSQKVTTPATVTMVRDSKDLLLTSDDNEFEPIVVEYNMNPWVWGDILATSPLSTTVDAITGAMWKYDDNITIPEK